eukprot:TRINITY_DN14117_c0_g1_i1.p1 TRINITY_DN14117_c0_g1~~TRINITY_DN14117_c0_g1_i1.p1  ORF type:complete len:139 (-),score=26.67 TRINITY_DN14117_c0_g1_i1:156-572(-)
MSQSESTLPPPPPRVDLNMTANATFVDQLFAKVFEGGHAVVGAQPSEVEYHECFPNTNQTKNCWANYVAYRQCLNAFDTDPENPAPACYGYWRKQKALCLDEWVEEWDTQVEEGLFPADLSVPEADKAMWRQKLEERR